MNDLSPYHHERSAECTFPREGMKLKTHVPDHKGVNIETFEFPLKKYKSMMLLLYDQEIPL